MCAQFYLATIFSPPLLFKCLKGSLTLCQKKLSHYYSWFSRNSKKSKIIKTLPLILPEDWRKLFLLFRNCFSISSFCTICDSPTLISNPKRNLDKVCRYATYYVGRRYMRKHARILHTLLWLMHQLSQSRKRCCISTFFYHDFNQDYYNESPISSIHHYGTVNDFEMFQ